MLGSRAPRCQMPSRLGRHLQRETGLFQSPELELYLTRVTDAAPQTTGVSKKWGISSLVLKRPCGAQWVPAALQSPKGRGVYRYLHQCLPEGEKQQQECRGGK